MTYRRFYSVMLWLRRKIFFLAGIIVHSLPSRSLRFYSFEKQQVETLVGKRGRGRADGPLADAALNRPRGLAELRDGSLVVVDTGNAVLRLIDAQWRTVTTLKQRFIEPYGVAARYDAKLGQLIYVSDRDQGCIYMLFCPKPADSKAVGDGGLRVRATKK